MKGFRFRGRKGASIVEYAVLVGLVSSLGLAAVYKTGLGVKGVMDTAQGDLNTFINWGDMIAVKFRGASASVRVEPGPSGEAVIHWGDGERTVVTSAGDHTYSYDISGDYTVRISGTVDKFRSLSDNAIEVISFGNVGLTSLEHAFTDEDMLERVTPVLPSTITDLGATFWRSDGALAGISQWDTRNVQSFFLTFHSANGMVDDLSGWKTDSATNMDQMFYNNTAITSDLSGWCVSNIGSPADNFGAVNATHPVWGSCPNPS